MYTFFPETFILPSALMELPTNIETEYYNHKNSWKRAVRALHPYIALLHAHRDLFWRRVEVATSKRGSAQQMFSDLVGSV